MVKHDKKQRERKAQDHTEDASLGESEAEGSEACHDDLMATQAIEDDSSSNAGDQVPDKAQACEEKWQQQGFAG